MSADGSASGFRFVLQKCPSELAHHITCLEWCQVLAWPPHSGERPCSLHRLGTLPRSAAQAGNPLSQLPTIIVLYFTVCELQYCRERIGKTRQSKLSRVITPGGAHTQAAHS